ncbi:MAG: hypothetical protein AAGD13_10305 [Pseudomonadota bacterium]
MITPPWAQLSLTLAAGIISDEEAGSTFHDGVGGSKHAAVSLIRAAGILPTGHWIAR